MLGFGGMGHDRDMNENRSLRPKSSRSYSPICLHYVEIENEKDGDFMLKSCNLGQVGDT